ncbi:MAG: flavin reductase family protein [Oscillospiraceae bacterium]|jgi:flavin reductase (DIM6/NTAB) family NADH-FMN oxidoreductase RutF
MDFREISVYEVPDNFFKRLSQDWMLLTVGAPGACNTMTASWGQFGFLWNRPVATTYVRPQRYTHEFIEREERFSLSFFAPGEHRRALEVLGSKSGRDGDKIALAGLTVVDVDGVAGFEEAVLTLVCRKLYRQQMLPECFLDKAADEANYPNMDYHTIYIGEVEHVFVK